jgi:hypothetical protein
LFVLLREMIIKVSVNFGKLIRFCKWKVWF